MKKPSYRVGHEPDPDSNDIAGQSPPKIVKITLTFTLRGDLLLFKN
jgi:hypothetical protein